MATREEVTNVVTVSTKGQVAIPAQLRQAMGIEQGAKFAAFAADDMIVLKRIAMPSVREFEDALKDASRLAKEHAIKPSDVDAALKQARA